MLRLRRAATALALLVGTALGTAVLIAGGLLVREGQVRDVADGMELTAYPVRSGLSGVSSLAFAPGGQLLVAERGGAIHVLASAESDAPLLASSVVPDVWEAAAAGLLSVAIGPDFEATRQVYACASRDTDGPGGRPPRNEVLQLAADAEWRLTVEEVVLRLSRANEVSNGCAMAVDADGNLWLALGDRRRPRLAIEPAHLEGKVLRIGPEEVRRLDRPAGKAQLRRYVVSAGLRDPGFFAFDPASGDAYVADRGSGREELNRIVDGADFGWPCQLGADANPNAPPAVCGAGRESQPPAWSTDPEARVGIAGVAFLAHGSWAEWEGDLVVTGRRSRDLRRVDVEPDGLVSGDSFLRSRRWRPGPVTLGPDGALYLAIEQHGETLVMRVAPSG